MKEVLAVTTNFGFGPVSKLCAILKGILKKYGDQVEITYYGNGESLNFIRRNLGDSVLYEYADSDSVEEKMFDAFNDGIIPRNSSDGSINIIADPSLTKGNERKFMAVKDFRKLQKYLLDRDYNLLDVNCFVCYISNRYACR